MQLPYALANRHTSHKGPTSMTIESIISAQMRTIREQTGFIARDGSLHPTSQHALKHQLREAIIALFHEKFYSRDGIDDNALLRFLTEPRTCEIWQHINAYDYISAALPTPESRP